MWAYLKNTLNRLAQSEHSSRKLAASFCLGIFIALTPTMPVQTPLIFLLSWLLGLNAGVAFASSWIANNPFTMVPIYIIDYAVGVWFFEKLVGIDLARYNPWWVDKFNAYLSRSIDVNKYFGGELCIWYLFLGGLIFATLVTLPLYPILKATFDKLIKQIAKRKQAEPL